MKTIKLFMMAALVLMTAACSSDDNDITTPTPQPVKPEGITITATLAPKNGGDDTRGLSERTDEVTKKDKIEATWEKDEKIAILYEVGGVKKKAEATVTAVNTETGAATIQFTVDSNTKDNTTCTLVFPYTAAKDDNTGVKDAATLLATQTGSLSSKFMDVRVGAGTIQTANPGLTVTTQPAAQNAIFQITAKTPNFKITLNALTVTIDGNEYAVNLADNSGWSEIYIALPPVTDKKVSFLAKDDKGRMFGYSKSGVTFTAGKYYKSELTMEYAFSVAADKVVSFSQGNLQYDGSTWKFAENQWGILDYNGTLNTSSKYPIDLFTWGNTTLGAEDYLGTGYDKYSSTLKNTQAPGAANSSTGSDWGYNAISNGGNKNSQWRTLTISEWQYLLTERTVNGGKGVSHSYTVGQSIDGIKGLVIYPDGYKGDAYSGNDWDTFEQNGCVFLPAGGYRKGQNVYSHSTSGYYWSADPLNGTYASYMSFENSNNPSFPTTTTGEVNKDLGYSVRLVRDL